MNQEGCDPHIPIKIPPWGANSYRFILHALPDILSDNVPLCKPRHLMLSITYIIRLIMDRLNHNILWFTFLFFGMSGLNNLG